MDPIEIEEEPGTRKVVIAKDQPQYKPLPALVYREGVIRTRWQLSFEERQALMDGAGVELWVWTFGSPLQPVCLQVQGVDYGEENL